MKSKIFPIIFTTLIACVLFFFNGYHENEASIKFNNEKFLEYDKTFEYVYQKGSEEIKTEFKYKIENNGDEKIAAIGVLLSDTEIIDGVIYPTEIDNMPVRIDRFKSYTLKDLEININDTLTFLEYKGEN